MMTDAISGLLSAKLAPKKCFTKNWTISFILYRPTSVSSPIVKLVLIFMFKRAFVIGTVTNKRIILKIIKNIPSLADFLSPFIKPKSTPMPTNTSSTIFKPNVMYWPILFSKIIRIRIKLLQQNF